MGCIYYARCKVNGKGYIGVDTRSDVGSARKRKHVRGAHRGRDVLFSRALRKYGVENFIWDPIWESDDEAALFARENFFIRWFETKAPFGYTIVDGGLGGYDPCEETRAKISTAAKMAWQRPEYRDKMTVQMQSPKYRAKMSANLKERWKDPAFEERIRNAQDARWACHKPKPPQAQALDACKAARETTRS